MAVRAYAFQTLPQTLDYQAVTMLQWTGLLNGDSGGPAEFGNRSDRTIQITGTFGAGGTIVIEGSLDGTNYATLNDPLGNALSFTAAGLKQVLECVRYIRPRVTGGDGTTSLVVTLYARGPR